MPMYEVTDDGFRPVPTTDFVTEAVAERADIQQWLLKHPAAIGDGLYIVAEEFSQWEDARRGSTS
jgi:RecB family endonuclease NucS